MRNRGRIEAELESYANHKNQLIPINISGLVFLKVLTMKTKWCGLDFEECGISGDLKKNLKEMPIAAADHEMPPGS